MFDFIVKLFIIFLLFPLNANAISAESAVLIDSHSGRVLFEVNSDKRMPMASTTKIMTGLLSVESGKLKETVKVSPFAATTEGSSLWLKPGEIHSLEDLTYGLMLNSGNDAAVAIAEFIGGNTEAFSLLMNVRAKEIGAINTNFENPHGLYSDNHYTTAYDLAIISREAMKNYAFRKIVSTKTHTISSQNDDMTRYLKNHNKLLWNYEGCIGVKTGFTKKSGRCLVTCAEKDGQELICVTLNAPDDWKDHISLLNYGFENFEAKVIVEKEDFACEYVYDKKNKRSVDLIYGESFIISKTKNDKITTKIEYRKISLPAKKGTIAGFLHIYLNEEKVKEIPLITKKELTKPSIFERIKNFIFSFFN